MHAFTKVVICIGIFVVTYVGGYALRDVLVGDSPNLKTIPAALGLRSEPKSELAATRTFVQVLANLELKYRGDVDRQEVTYVAIQGMMDALKDPYTAIMPPEEAKRFDERSRGKFVGSGGIGAELSPDPMGARIRRVFKNGPASRSLLRPDDIIVAVGGKEIMGLAIEDVVTEIRGDEGTSVRLSIYRTATKETFEKVLTRQKVQIQDVYGEVLSGAYVRGGPLIGRLEVRSYSETIVEQFDEELSALEKPGIRGLIIDLRGNPGGLMGAAIDMASRFVDGRLIVSMRRKTGQPEKYFARNGLAQRKPYPIVILATIVGEHTYGKAAVQNVVALVDGAQAKITIARYYLPNGDLIQRVEDERGEYSQGGIKPAVEVILDRGVTPGDPEKDNQLQKAAELIIEKLGS
jgi:carboxyl-terminal processing protease